MYVHTYYSDAVVMSIGGLGPSVLKGHLFIGLYLGADRPAKIQETQCQNPQLAFLQVLGTEDLCFASHSQAGNAGFLFRYFCYKIFLSCISNNRGAQRHFCLNYYVNGLVNQKQKHCRQVMFHIVCNVHSSVNM